LEAAISLQERHGTPLVLSGKSPLFLSATLEHYVSTRLVSVVLVGSFLCGVVLLASCSHSTPPPDGPDTTSHNFVWQIQMLGDGGSSVLHDVAIINDTLAYAVGELYLNDSTGQLDPLLYNVAQWDGNTWQVRRVSVLYRGSFITSPLDGIFARSATDIWLSSGVPIHGDGQQWQEYNLFDMGVLGQNDGSLRRIWSSSPNSVYFVGNRGTIVCFDGTMWQRIESGTTLPIQDIWGAVNPNTGVTEIYAVASNYIAVPSGKKLLRITSTNATAMSDSGLNMFLNSIWFCPGSPYYIVGGGFFYSGSITQSTIWQGAPNIVTTYYSLRIRGTASNDIFIVGAYGDVVHFNGSTWKSFQQQTAFNGNYWSVAMKGNLVIAVGGDGDRAVVAIGRRR
jgi:hypothetical protein